VRPVRRTDRMARPALRGVCGAQARVHAGTGRLGVRRSVAPGRGRVEGARLASASRVGGGSRGRVARTARRVLSRLRAGRSRPQAHTRSPRGRTVDLRARPPVGPARSASTHESERLTAPTWSHASRAPPKRGRSLPCAQPGTGARCARRRRLYDRRDGERGRVGVAKRRCQKRRGRDVRPHDSHSLG
jgi:hypothetical protein